MSLSYLSLAAEERPAMSLKELARIRGAMWTQRLNLPLGPYPGEDYNINAMDYYEQYDSDDRKRMIEKTLIDGYTHAVTGPLYDEGGYHGKWAPQTDISQRVWDAYLDGMQEWWDAGITPVHFVKPDNWTLEDVQRRLEPFYLQPRAKALLPIKIPAGWEPTRYGWSSRTWGTFFDWMAQVDDDQSLILAHTVNDVDALVGTDMLYDDNGRPNAESWVYLAPKLHGWLIQLNGFNDIPINAPDYAQRVAEWEANLAAYYRDADRRFRHGYAGWPTGSKFGADVPLKLYYGEGASYTFFNQPSVKESLVRRFGDISVANGADGYLDAGSVALPEAA